MSRDTAVASLFSSLSISSLDGGFKAEVDGLDISLGSGRVQEVWSLLATIRYVVT